MSDSMDDAFFDEHELEAEREIEEEEERDRIAHLHEEAARYAPESPQGDVAMEDAGASGQPPQHAQEMQDEGEEEDEAPRRKRGAKRSSRVVNDDDGGEGGEQRVEHRAAGLHAFGAEDEEPTGRDGTKQRPLVGDLRTGGRSGASVAGSVDSFSVNQSAHEMRAEGLNLRAIHENRKRVASHHIAASGAHAAGSSAQSSGGASALEDEYDDAEQDAREGQPQPQQEEEKKDPYPGFDEKLLCWTISKDDLDKRKNANAQPFVLSDFRDWHVKLPSEVNAKDGPRMRPRRAMVWNIPAFYFRADANYFRHWERRQHGVNTQGVHSRMQAHAALVSLMFAGLQQGIATGQLSKRGGGGGDAQKGKPDTSGGEPPEPKERSGPVFDYVFRPQHLKGTDWPCFEICYEDLYEEYKIDVAAVRIWLMVCRGTMYSNTNPDMITYPSNIPAPQTTVESHTLTCTSVQLGTARHLALPCSLAGLRRRLFDLRARRPRDGERAPEGRHEPGQRLRAGHARQAGRRRADAASAGRVRPSAGCQRL